MNEFTLPLPAMDSDYILQRLGFVEIERCPPRLLGAKESVSIMLRHIADQRIESVLYMTTTRYEMSFLNDLASDAGRILTESEQRILEIAHEALVSADAVIIHIGGKSGRLGEAIVGSAFLEGTLQTLVALDKQHIALTVILDESIAELAPVAEYRARYWPEIVVIVASPNDVDRMGVVSAINATSHNILVLDFHAEHDGMPYLDIEHLEQ